MKRYEAYRLLYFLLAFLLTVGWIIEVLEKIGLCIRHPLNSLRYSLSRNVSKQ